MEKKDLISFPFRPHLAKYLFNLLQNEVIDTPEAYYRHLDIDMRSAEGRMLRMLCQPRKGRPRTQMPTKGFRLTICIPKQARNHLHLATDSRRQAVWIDDETATLLQDHFEKRFREHFMSFVSGAVHGSGHSRGQLKKAILYFMDQYSLHDEESYYTYDQLLKYFKRRNTFIKPKIYRKGPKPDTATSSEP
jgi:hypothetical protein